MYSSYDVSSTILLRSTPSLEPDSHEYSSPPDDYLTTPDLSEWREIRLEYEKDKKLDGDAQNDLGLPALEECKQEPVDADLPPDLPVWPYTTIAPEDAFPDYAEVCQYLQELARPLSPISEYELDEPEIPLCADVETSPHPALLLPASPSPLASLVSPVRRIGKKAKRNEDDDDDNYPAPKRHRSRVPTQGFDSDIESDDDRDHADDDDGYQQPSRRPVKRRTSTHPRPKVNRHPSAPKPTKSNRGEDYQEGPCSCRAEGCQHCMMTCFYTFVHGPRKGEVCRRLFGEGRHLDLKRHKVTHAVQEWKLLEDGEISRDEAYWHLVVFKGKEHGLMCPNGDCLKTFTRYDALKRHMERGTCHHGKSANDDLDNRQMKSQVIKASNEKRARMAEAKQHA